MIATNSEPVAYMCAKHQGNWLTRSDSKIYKRLGDAKKRCERLTILDGDNWEIVCAYGWSPLEAGDDN